MTAALAARSSSERITSAEQGGGSTVVGRRQHASQITECPSVAGVMTGGDLLHGVDDAGVPEEELLGARRIEPQQVARVRAASGAASSVRSSATPVGANPVTSSAAHPCGVFGELIRDENQSVNGDPRRSWRSPSVKLDGPMTGPENRVVDRGVAGRDDLDRGAASGDHPGLEGGIHVIDASVRGPRTW